MIPAHAAWTGLRHQRMIPSAEEVGEAAGVDEAAETGQHIAQTAAGGGTVTVSNVGSVSNTVERLSQNLHEVTTMSQEDSKATFTEDGNTNYLIASFTRLKVINYARLPDLVWRPIVTTGLFTPQSIAIDEDRGRLYIADPGAVKVVWYQLLAFDQRLLTDGRQHVAVVSMNARNIAVDLAGNLWVSGATTPVPPIEAVDAIWKQSRLNIEQASSTGLPIEPAPVWRSSWTNSNPYPLALDAFNIFYGNMAAGKEKGSVVKTTQEAPLTESADSLIPIADNVDSVFSVAVTPTLVFYGADNAIYGILKTKSTSSCGQDSSMCTVISEVAKKPTAMVWDGDGSIFLADNGNGAVYSFAAGSVSPHALEKVLDAADVWGLDMFRVSNDQSSARPEVQLRSSVLLVLVCLIAAFFVP